MDPGVGHALLVALGYQGARIWPSPPLHAVEAETLASCPAGARVPPARRQRPDDETGTPSRSLTSSVASARPLCCSSRPMRVDAQLAPLRGILPSVVAHPRPDTYGLHLFSRFPLSTRRSASSSTGTCPRSHGVRLPSAPCRLPRHAPETPPLQDTARRDAELLLTAREVRTTTGSPSIVAATSRFRLVAHDPMLQAVGGLLDPRIGRGPYPTFHADWPLLRWPLDPVFFAGVRPDGSRHPRPHRVRSSPGPRGALPRARHGKPAGSTPAGPDGLGTGPRGHP